MTAKEPSPSPNVDDKTPAPPPPPIKEWRSYVSIALELQAMRQERDELLEALRELYDFGEPTKHYRHQERAAKAFAHAAALLKKAEGE